MDACANLLQIGIVTKRSGRFREFRTTKPTRRNRMFKKLSTMIFFGLLTLSAARAQSSPPTQALVPFAFHVQSRVYPAGTYRLTFDLKTNVLSLRGADQISQSGFFLVTPAEESHRTKEGAGLVFKCYDKSCYLAQVWQS